MREIAIDVKGDIFFNSLQSINRKLAQCLSELVAGNFESGDIVFKIGVKLTDASDEVKKMNKDGFVPIRLDYQFPTFDQKVTLYLKKKTESEDYYSHRNMALVESADGYIVQPVKTSQINLDEYNREDD